METRSKKESWKNIKNDERRTQLKIYPYKVEVTGSNPVSFARMISSAGARSKMRLEEKSMGFPKTFGSP